MKKILAITLVAMVAATSVQADAVSISWKQFAGGVNDVLDGYGVEAANNWNNSQAGLAWNDSGLSSGTPSTIDVAVTAPGGFITVTGGGILDNTPMRTGIGVFAGGGSVTLSDINATFTTYDVIVYLGGYNAAGNGGAVSDGATTYYYSPLIPYSASLIQSTDTNSGDGLDGATYVRFNGLSADSTTISLSQIQGGLVLGGVQVVGTVIPEPATLGLFGIAGAGVLFARRRARS